MIPDRKRLLDAVENAKLDPIEAARRRLRAEEGVLPAASSWRETPTSPQEMLADLDALVGSPEEHYAAALARLAQAARAFRRSIGFASKLGESELEAIRSELCNASAAADAAGERLSPGVCRECGCTEMDACRSDEDGQVCSWTDASETLCTACER